MKKAMKQPATRKPTKKKAPKKYVFPVVFEKDAEGYYVYCPELQGCYTDGDTYEEALANIDEAIRLHVEDRLENGEEVPVNEVVSFATLEVEV
jgi:predicted RNase H-like HicB family nuclease